MRNSELFYRKTYCENEKLTPTKDKLFDDKNITPCTKSHNEPRTENILFLKKFIANNNFNEKTYFLACLYFDYILSKSFYKKYKNDLKLDLIVISCVLLSSKFNENDPFIPNLRQIQTKNSQDNNYTLKEIKKYEELCVKLLYYKLDLILAYDYISLFFKIGVFTLDEKNTLKSSIGDIYNQCISILYEFVHDIKFPEFSQLEIALACMSLIREVQGVDHWIKLFEEIYHVNFEYFKNCYDVLKKRNKKLFQPKVNTYKKTELFLNLNLNLKDINLENLPFTPLKNKHTLSIFNIPNTTRDKKLKSIDYLFSKVKSTDIKESGRNLCIEQEEKEQQESVQKENLINSKITIKRDMIREILKENSSSFRENFIKENLMSAKEKIEKEDFDKIPSNNSTSFVRSSIGKISSLLKKRNITSLIDSKLIHNESAPDITSIIQTYNKESNKNLSNKKINASSSKIIPSLTKVMNIKKYQDSLTMNSSTTDSNLQNKYLLRQNTMINIKKDLFPSLKSISTNASSSQQVYKKPSCNIQEANTIYQKLNFYQKDSLGDFKKFSNLGKPEIDSDKLNTNFLKDRLIYKKK
jgi:hypothetical protein